jgi:hypothetical protein
VKVENDLGAAIIVRIRVGAARACRATVQGNAPGGSQTATAAMASVPAAVSVSVSPVA